MTTPNATLREITDAITETLNMESARARDEAFAENLYSRARTMRDRGFIRTAARTTQGREIVYSGADIAAAVVAITISLNGGSYGQISAINGSLRKFDNTQGIRAYEDNLPRILDGVPIYVRLDIVSHPWPVARARMGTLSEIELNDAFEWRDALGHLNIITESIILPVTALVTRVFDVLRRVA